MQVFEFFQLISKYFAFFFFSASLSVVEEEKQASLCANLSVLMDMMYHSLQNLFLLEEEAEAVSTQANSPLAEFIFFGLSAVIPLIDFKSLPTVSHFTAFHLLHLFWIRTLFVLSSHNNSSLV